jgi:hypothetical protein
MLKPRQAVALANRVLAARYPDALCGLVTGSLARGEGVPGSDLDLLVIFERIPAAHRDSFVFESLPVEVFAHDPETLAWAMGDEHRIGRPAMTHMIAESRLAGPHPETGRRSRAQARKLYRAGPEPMDAERRDLLRYHVTDRLVDLADPRPREEVIALGVWLYDPLAELILRGAGQWGASGKWIPRRLAAIDPKMGADFVAAFDALFARADAGPLIAFADAALAPHGGRLFEGYESAWPADRRIAAPR